MEAVSSPHTDPERKRGHTNPFPGLRPFRSDEHHLFFGREEQTAALLQLLRTNRFLAVVGTSGSGKSSLVRAGMIAALHGGTMTQAGSAWEVMLLRPGGSPIANLARAFADADLYDSDDPSTLPRLLATLNRSRFGLVEAMKQSELFVRAGSVSGGSVTNLLVVADQFEELFRFRQQGVDSEETAAAFVNLLLTASAQAECPIYVTITMRSDYLGDCSEIPGLAEAVNEGEYLIPRLLRDQKRDAIEKPIGVGGAKISPLLVQRLLNEVGDDPDQLPVLQHALMRMWDVWSAGSDYDRPIDFGDFEATGGLASALSNHADEIYDVLPDDRHRSACEKIFKTLTEKGADNRGIRRPTRLAQLQAIAAADRGTVTMVLDAFRGSGVTFLMPGMEAELGDRTVIDLSHESLMRGWQRLRGWVDEEAQSARIFRRLLDTARLWKDGKAGLFRDPDLQIALSWREQESPNSDWAVQYGGHFETALGFLETSNADAQAERQAKEAARQRELDQARQLAEAQRLRLEQQKRAAHKLRQMIAGLAAVAVIAGLACVAALIANRRASTEADNARENATRAEQSQQEAEKARAVAQAETYRAMLSEVRALRAGHQPGWREAALADLARLGVMPTARRDLVELRSEAVASIAEFDVKEVARLEAPGGIVCQLDFSPDSRTLVTASQNGDLNFWDVSGRKYLQGLVGAPAVWYGRQVLFLPDGELAFLSSSSRISFVEASGRKSARAPIERGSLKAVKLGIDRQGRSLAVSWEDGRIDLLDAGTGALRRSFTPGNPDFACSPDGQWLAVQGGNGSIQLLPTSGQGPPITLGHLSASYRLLVFSPDGTTMAGVEGRSLVLWDLASKQELMRLGGHKEMVTGVAFSPDGALIATSCGDHLTRIWDARDGRALAVLPGPGYMATLAFSPDGGYLAASATSGPVCLYQLKGRREQRRLAGHRYGARCLAFHPRLPRFASGSDDHDIIVWDADAAHPLARWTAQTSWVRGLAYSPDGALLATTCGDSVKDDIDHSIHLWNAESGKPWKNLPRTSHWGIHTLAFDSTGRRLVSGDQGGTVLLWDVESGKILHRENLEGSPVTSAVFVNKSRQLLVGYSGGTVALFDLEGSGLIRRTELPRGCAALAVDEPGNRVLVADSKGGLSALSVPDLAVVHRLDNANEDVIYSLGLSPDGRLLATGGKDRRVVLRNPLTFEALMILPAWTGAVMDLSFDASGRWLALAGADSDVSLWDLGMVHDELAALGLAWDQAAPAVTSAEDLAPVFEPAKNQVPVIRPWTTDPAEFDKARRLVVSGVGAFREGRLADAIRDLEAASGRLRTLLRLSPNDGRLSSNLGVSLGFLGSALRDSHRPVEALASIQAQRSVLESMRNPGSIDLYNLACGYAQLTLLLEHAATPPTVTEREALADRAMEALRRSLAAGRNDFALLESDHDLDPLRERPDFRALISESTGRTREAVPHLAKASAANPKDTFLSSKVAALQAWFGQNTELAASRQRILAFAKDTNDAVTAERAAMAGSMLPSTDKTELEAALALGRRAVKAGEGGGWNLLALGMAEYRSGNYAAALEPLLAAADVGSTSPTVTGIAAFYRAMGLFRQGDADEARKVAIAAAAKMKPLPKDENNPLANGGHYDELIMWLAYKEAKALIQFDPVPPNSENDKK